MTSQVHDSSLMTASDATLVATARNGAHAAYTELCRRHSHVALCMIQRITRNKEDSEDVLQETMMRAFVHLDKFDGRSSFSTWFTRIAINSALMSLRKKRTTMGSVPDSSIDLDSEAWRYPELTDPSPNPETHYAQREAERHVRKAVRGLPPILRHCIEVRYANDFSVAEVAAHVGISVAAAKSRLLRAKNELSSKMTAPRNGSASNVFKPRQNLASKSPVSGRSVRVHAQPR